MSLSVINNKVYKKCSKCEHNQDITTGEHIFQDITGKYVFCTKCRNLTPTEYDEYFFDYYDIKDFEKPSKKEFLK